MIEKDPFWSRTLATLNTYSDLFVAIISIILIPVLTLILFEGFHFTGLICFKTNFSENKIQNKLSVKQDNINRQKQILLYIKENGMNNVCNYSLYNKDNRIFNENVENCTV